jgi:hypothetical protein
MKHGTIVVLAVVAAMTASIGAPIEARAQGAAPGQVVQAVAKLNSAQMTLVKRLADDAAFARQFEAARSSGNADATASLVSEATGIAKANIRVGSGGLTMNPGPGDAARENGSAFRLARFDHVAAAPSSASITGKVCFDFGVVAGCIAF